MHASALAQTLSLLGGRQSMRVHHRPACPHIELRCPLHSAPTRRRPSWSCERGSHCRSRVAPQAAAAATRTTRTEPHSAAFQEQPVDDRPDAEIAVSLERALQDRNLSRYLDRIAREKVQASSSFVRRHAQSWNQPDKELEQQHVRFLNLAVDQGHIDAAVQLLKLVPQKSLWTFLLKAVGASADCDRLQSVLQAREAAGFPADAYSASATLATAGRAKDGVLAQAVLQQAWQEGYATTFVCSAAIQAFARCGDPQAALVVHQRMLEEGVTIDTRVFNALIFTAGRHRMQDKAKAFFQQLCDQGLHPTEHTYSLLFQAFCSQQHENGAWLLQVLSSMASYGVQANEYIIVSFMNAARHARLQRSQIVSVGSRMTTFLEHRRWHGSAYAAMLTFCADHPELGISLVKSIWYAAQQARCHTDPLLASALFSACASSGAEEAQPLIRQAHGQLEVFWRLHSTSQPPEFRAKTLRAANRGHGDLIVSYNALLRAYCECHCLKDANAAYHSMPDKNLKATLTTMNTMMSGYAKAGDTQRAFQLLGSMYKNRAVPDVVTYGALMHACATTGKVQLANRAFEMMKKANVTPNAEIFTSYIDAHVKAGTEEFLEQAFEVFEAMQARKITPTVVTYGCLLAACQQMGDAERAFCIYRESSQLGFKDGSLLDLLIQVCAATERLDEGLKLVKQLERSFGHDAYAAGLDSLAHALAGASVERALRVVSLLRTRGGCASRATLLRLMSACARASHSQEARHLYWELRQVGYEPSSSAGSNVIMALCRANAPTEALRIFDDMMSTTLAAAKQKSSPEAAQDGHNMPSSWSGPRHILESEPDMRPEDEMRPTEPISVPGRLEMVLEQPAPGAMMTMELESSVSEESGRGARKAITPQPGALLDLVQTLASTGELLVALRVYSVMRRLGSEAVATVSSAPQMWQALIEACCRQANISAALKVFDDWRTFAERQATARGEGTATARISNVTLAFLEAHCRSSQEHAWRVLDVCAEMRHQSELRQQAHLPHPLKASHHFLDPPGRQQ